MLSGNGEENTDQIILKKCGNLSGTMLAKKPYQINHKAMDPIVQTE